MLELDKQDQQDIFACELIVVVVLTKEETNKQKARAWETKAASAFPLITQVTKTKTIT